MDARPHMLVRLLISSGALAFVIVGLVALTPGFGTTALGFLLFLGVVGTPFAFYVVGMRTLLGSYLTGFALLALTVWVQVYVNAHSFSSTVAVSYYSVFFWGLAIVFVALLIERVVRRSDRGSYADGGAGGSG